MDKHLNIFCDPLALNFSQEVGAPEWVQLMPAGETIRGVDGRTWTMNDAPAIIETFQKRGLRLPIDIEHSTQVKGAAGEVAPAVGWIIDLEVRATGLWGKVEWNETGRDLVASRAYGYLSPVFIYGRKTGSVTRMVSAGLTNNPNLDLVALNQAGQIQETEMDKTVLEALGLNSDATAQDAVGAINKLKADEAEARNRADQPDLTKFVPRADYDTAMNRVQDYETQEAERKDAEIETVVGAAVTAGKITPATRDYHIAACRSEGGLEAFKTMIEGAPVIAKAEELGDTPGKDGAASLTAEELAACSALDLTPEEFAASKADSAQE